MLNLFLTKGDGFSVSLLMGKNLLFPHLYLKSHENLVVSLSTRGWSRGKQTVSNLQVWGGEDT